jgi:DNA-binding transcriptional MerR regulator
VSSRTYLSIGDVLALLRQEFPDVTISKIRFLESQGLVNPERTPSGYRKFYEHDVERLRWVLRQQREHFLPLKVIKGRLEQEVADYADDNGHDAVGVSGHEPALVGRAAGPGGPRAAGRELPGFESPGSETVRTGAEAGRAAPARPVPGPGSARTARPSPPTTVGTPPRSTGSPRALAGGSRTLSGATGSGPAPAPASTSGSRPAPAPAPGPGRGVPAPTRPPGSGAVVPGVPTPAKVSGEAAMGSTDVRSRRPPARPAAGDGTGDELLDAMSGPGMTVQELAAGSGLDVASVEELESYGLLCGRVVGGVSYYDEDALTVAQVAAGLAPYGVEARHLRLHKHAAEREAGFIEQIVLPLLKQRNPEARVRAHEIVSEVTLLGQRLREVLLRTTLRDQLGG